MSEISKETVPTYKLPGITSTSTLDLLEKILSFYSTYHVISGKGFTNLKPQLIELLAIYILKGYNKDSKKLATKMLNLKDSTRINGLNKELRDAGYIVKDKGNEHISHLNADLTALGINFPILDDSIPKLKKKGVDSIRLSIEIDIKFP